VRLRVLSIDRDGQPAVAIEPCIGDKPPHQRSEGSQRVAVLESQGVMALAHAAVRS
jgi:hypothetical protein